MSDLWPLVILGILAIEALCAPVQKIVSAFRITPPQENDSPRPADPVNANQFAADVLRSCANHIAESNCEPRLAILYLLATANELTNGRPPVIIPDKYPLTLKKGTP